MTEFQELMLYSCFGTLTGVFIGELVVLIVSAVTWAKDKIRKRKEKKNSTKK